MLFCRLLIFKKIKLFRKFLSGIPVPSECQMVWIQIRPDMGPNCMERLPAAPLVGKELNNILYICLTIYRINGSGSDSKLF